MGFYRVRVGQELGVNGVTKREGDVVELTDHLATEIGAKVDPCTADGQLLVDRNPDEIELGRARVHERVSLAQQHVARCKAELAAAEARLAEEQRREAQLAAPKAKATKVDTPVKGGG